METLFRKVLVTERVPSEYGYYDTNEGQLEFSTDSGWLWPQPQPEYWYETVQLPNKEEIKEFINSQPYYGLCNSEYQEGIEEGANYILGFINNKK